MAPVAMPALRPLDSRMVVGGGERLGRPKRVADAASARAARGLVAAILDRVRRIETPVRVTPEVANSTNHFREALNELLADGEPIF